MTRISVRLTEDGIQKAIDALDAWTEGKLEPFADAVADDVTGYVFMDMDEKVHVGSEEFQDDWDEHEPGRLKRSIHVLKLGSGSYQIIADATDNRGDPYAEEEMLRHSLGGEITTSHNFAALATDIDKDPAKREELYNAVNVFADMHRSQL